MNARAAFAEGRRVVNQNKAMWLLFLIGNWAFASFLIFPVFGLFSDTLSHSLYGERLFKEFDPQWIAELSYNYRGIPTLITPLLIAAVVLYLLLNTFLAGGVLNVFNASDQRFSLPRFFGGCGKYFPRLFRLFLFSLLFYGLVLGANSALAKLFDKLTENSTVERPVALLSWLRTALVLFLFCLVNMTFDYAKIMAVVDESRRAVRETFRAMRFIADHLRRTLGLYFRIGLVGIGFLLMYQIVAGLLPAQNIPLLLLLLLLQQIFILSKIWIRLTYFSSERALYQALRPAIVPPPAEAPLFSGERVEPMTEPPVPAVGPAPASTSAGEEPPDSSSSPGPGARSPESPA